MTRREKLLKIIPELMEVLNAKNISPDEAEAVASMLERVVKESNEKAMRRYMETSVFHGSSPER
ncbi:MAG: hypothetical protein V8Q73_02660 [Blautia sp.]